MDTKIEEQKLLFFEGIMANLRDISDQLRNLNDILNDLSATIKDSKPTPGLSQSSVTVPPQTTAVNPFYKGSGRATPAMVKYVEALIKQGTIPSDIQVDLDNLSFIRAKELLDTYAPKRR